MYYVYVFWVVSFLQAFGPKNLYACLIFRMRATYLDHIILLALITLIIFKKIRIMNFVLTKFVFVILYFLIFEFTREILNVFLYSTLKTENAACPNLTTNWVFVRVLLLLSAGLGEVPVALHEVAYFCCTSLGVTAAVKFICYWSPRLEGASSRTSKCVECKVELRLWGFIYAAVTSDRVRVPGEVTQSSSGWLIDWLIDWFKVDWNMWFFRTANTLNKLDITWHTNAD
jgi:hypothetical protein